MDILKRMELLKTFMSNNGYNLYPHQEQGISWMLERELGDLPVKGGLLCDDPGLGKTIQTLGLIKSNNYGGRQLIICPVSLIEQWRNVASQIFPDQPIRVCSGINQYYNKDEIEKVNAFITIASYNAVFSSSTKNNEYLKTPLHEVQWERVILDECHTIRNKNTKVFKGCHDIRAKYRWGLSGTPLQNKLADIQTLFRFLHHSEVAILGNLEFLKENYIMRRNRHILPDAYKGLNIHIDDVGFETEEEQTFYNNLKDEVRKEFIRSTNEDGNNHMATIFELLLRLRQATIHPSIVWNGLYRKYREMDDQDVDLKAIERKIAYWNKRTSTKMSRLVHHFANHTEHTKSLVFTHYTEESYMVLRSLKTTYPNLKVEIFDGSLSLERRNHMIAKAEKGEIDCMIIQILCGGVGLNLQMFNRVYLVTPDWNPANEIQAIARCHRIGQKTDVEVIKIVVRLDDHKPTIDEKIILIQQQKRELMAQHLDDDTLLFNERIRGNMNLTIKDFTFLLK